jgi:hypothetical protein
MAQKTAVVRQALGLGVPDTTDFTSSGFGDVSAAIGVICGAGAGTNPSSGGDMVVFFWDGTNVISNSVSSTDNVGSSDTVRYHSGSDIDFYSFTNGGLTSFSVTGITDGIQLEMTLDSTTSAHHCTVLLLGGIDAAVTNFQVNNTQDAAQTSPSLGIAPKYVFIMTVNKSNTTGNSSQRVFSFGVGDESLNQYAFGQYVRDAVGTSSCKARYSSSRIAIAQENSLDWTGELTNMGADTFEITTRDSAAVSKRIYALALGGDVSMDIGKLSTPTTATTQTISTSVSPEAVLILSSLIDVEDTTDQAGIEPESICIGLSDGTNDYLHQTCDGDGISNTNCRSVSSTTGVIDLDSESSGFNDEIDAAVNAFNDADFELSYSLANSTSRFGWWAAFGTAPETSGNIYHHLQQMGVY